MKKFLIAISLILPMSANAGFFDWLSGADQALYNIDDTKKQLNEFANPGEIKQARKEAAGKSYNLSERRDVYETLAAYTKYYAKKDNVGIYGACAENWIDSDTYKKFKDEMTAFARADTDPKCFASSAIKMAKQFVDNSDECRQMRERVKTSVCLFDYASYLPEYSDIDTDSKFQTLAESYKRLVYTDFCSKTSDSEEIRKTCRDKTRDFIEKKTGGTLESCREANAREYNKAAKESKVIFKTMDIKVYSIDLFGVLNGCDPSGWEFQRDMKKVFGI
jgi:hypothetical protein